MPDHLDTFLDELDLQTDIETNRISRAELAMLASIRRLIRREGDRIMASLDNLTAIETQTSADLSKAADDVLAAIAALQATIADLQVGQVTQDQIDALAAQAQGIDDAVNALDAAVKPA